MSDENTENVTQPPETTVVSAANEAAEKERRTGKVARLSKEARDRVNVMILDGVPYREIIERLGPEGAGLNEQNLTNWKQGGYQDWLADQERNQALVLRRDSALSLLEKKAGATVQDAGRTIAAAQLYELLLCFDPGELAQAVRRKPELYFRLVAALARLSEGEAVCGTHRNKQSALDPKARTNTAGQPSNVITQEALRDILQQLKVI
jgi:hypothetical protein